MLEQSPQTPSECILLSCKSDFPVFSHHPELHYLDSAATTHKPQCVIDALTGSYEQHCAPVHRGLYDMAAQASLNYEKARLTVARFINAEAPENCVFTRSATESVNVVASGWARHQLKALDEVVVTEMEHHANYLPWQRVCEQTGAKLRVVKVSADGDLLMEDASYWSHKIKLIVITHVSNVLGTINPITQIVEKARKYGIPVLVDASQSVGHMPVDVQELDCTFLVCSAHKCYGPEGIGLLYGKQAYLEQCEPLLLGGGMVVRVSMHTADSDQSEKTSWTRLPARLEAGSPNLSGALGFAAAIDYVQHLGVDKLQAHTGFLARQASEKLTQIDGVSVIALNNNNKLHNDNAGIVSFNVDAIHPHDVAQTAADHNVAIRAGHHCAQPLMNALGVGSTVRASFAAYNTEQDIDALLCAIENAIEMYRR